MSNPGGRLGRSVLSPETRIIDHEDRIKILERLRVATQAGGGARLLSGQGPPPGSLGEDGDFYIDYLNWVIYGPKLGTWPPGVSIIGPPGGMEPRRDVIFNTGILAHAASAQFVVDLYPQDRIIRVAVTAGCRIRAYATLDQLEADVDRSVFLDPDIEINHGLLLEVSMSWIRLPVIDLSPVTTVYRKMLDGDVYFNVTNTHGSTTDIRVTLTTTRSE